MSKIITSTFVTLDGVMQAPGGSEEDRSSGFAYGGWQYDKYDDEISGNIMKQFVAIPFDLLLGRLTYDIFAGFWPHHKDGHSLEKLLIALKNMSSHINLFHSLGTTPNLLPEMWWQQ